MADKRILDHVTYLVSLAVECFHCKRHSSTSTSWSDVGRHVGHGYRSLVSKSFRASYVYADSGFHGVDGCMVADTCGVKDSHEFRKRMLFKQISSEQKIESEISIHLPCPSSSLLSISSSIPFHHPTIEKIHPLKAFHEKSNSDFLQLVRPVKFPRFHAV